MKREYTDKELKRLHVCLYGILEEIIRVCKECDIPYFIIGGTAIGAFFDNDILPWDDDIDIGMTRENYNRFLQEAPKVLKKEYFLQWVKTDKDTPFYFAKVRKNNTSFIERPFKKLKIHPGIFIDIFPFDKVPDNQGLQKAQRILCNFLNGCFMGKSIWQWKYCGKCDIEKPRPRGFIPCLMTRIVDLLFSKDMIYRMLCACQGMFNGHKTTYYNMVLMPRDHISVQSIKQPQVIRLGEVEVIAPSDLETYLRHHYPNLRRHIPKDEQQNHRPAYLSFDEELKPY